MFVLVIVLYRAYNIIFGMNFNGEFMVIKKISTECVADTLYKKLKNDSNYSRLLDCLKDRSFIESPVETSDVLKEKGEPSANNMNRCIIITVFHNWSKYKVGYRFDYDLINTLVGDGEDIEIPSKVILDNMPYPFIWIDNEFVKDSTNYYGVFVSLQSEVALTENGDELYDLCIFPVPEMEEGFLECYKIPLLKNMNVSLAQIHSLHEYQERKLLELYPQYRQDSEKLKANNKRAGFDEEYAWIRRIFPMVLYLCCCNKDISDRKSSTPKEKYDNSKRAKKGTKEYDVGFRIGSVIRSKKTSSDKNDSLEIEKSIGREHSNHKSPVPHLRRGHFHHYWTGKKGEEKKLIVKYINSLYVIGQPDVTLIHPVK